jgi:hypothetical protein
MHAREGGGKREQNVQRALIELRQREAERERRREGEREKEGGRENDMSHDVCLSKKKVLYGLRVGKRKKVVLLSLLHSSYQSESP